MFSIINNLYEKNKIISMLLKHDAIIFGSFIRDVITNKLNLDDNISYTTSAIVSNTYKKIIERNLYHLIEDKIDYNTVHGPLKGNGKIDYILKSTYKKKKNCLKILRIYYITEIISFEKNGFLKHYQKYVLLDINSIGINRSGIKLIGEQDDIPNPFYNILHNIYNQELSIIGKIKGNFNLDLIYDYLDSGWNLKKRQLIEKKGQSFKHDDVCNICMDKIKVTDTVYQLSCKHFYHKDCWKKNVYQFVQNYYNDVGAAVFEKEKIIKCPYCRKEFKLKEVL